MNDRYLYKIGILGILTIVGIFGLINFVNSPRNYKAEVFKTLPKVQTKNLQHII